MATTSRATLKGYFNTGDTPTEGNFQDLIDSALNLQDGGTIIATGSGMISFASGSTDAFHASAPPFIPHLIPGLKVWSIAGSDNPSAAGLPVADNATTGPWLFDDANSAAVARLNNDADFTQGALTLVTGGSDGHQTELSTKATGFTCKPHTQWWVEAEFKCEDHDACEFFFGLAEEAITTDSWHLVAAAAGKDKVGFVKAVHNQDGVAYAACKNGGGTISASLDTNLLYDTDADILNLGIYWDGTSLKFYNTIRATGAKRADLTLNTTVTSNIPDDSNLRLCLYNETGEGATHTMTINYVRGAIWS